MSDNLPWKTWTPDDLAPPQAEFVPMVEPEETIIEEADPSLEQQLAQLQMQAHEQGYQAGIAEGRQQGHEQGYQEGLAQGLEQGLAKAKSQLNKRQFMPGCSNWSANFKLPLMRLIV